MDELIYYYIKEAYTQELSEEIFRSFILFDNFNYLSIYDEVLELITNESYTDTSSLSDLFFVKIMNSLDYILNEHKIKLIDEATIEEKNNFLFALFTIQELEDYTGIIALLESLETDEEKLSIIISDISDFDQVDVLKLIESFNPIMLNILKKYIYKKEENIKDEKINSELMNNLQLFAKFKRSEITNTLIVNILPGSNFDTYYSLSSSYIDNEPNKVIVVYLLTILFMSSNAYDKPLEFYREHSSNIFNDLNKINEIETLIIQTLNNFSEFKEAENEKVRLSQTSNN